VFRRLLWWRAAQHRQGPHHRPQATRLGPRFPPCPKGQGFPPDHR
jgi:hypothetical protein